MLSKKTQYAFQALTWLGRREENSPALISTIATETKVPKKFLEAILLDLKKMGVLNSRMGKGGGYYLLRQAKDIHLAEIIRKFNGPIALLPCVSLNYYEPCGVCINSAGVCGLKHVMEEVRDQSLKILEGKSLVDIV